MEALETFWEGSDNLDDYKDKQKRRFVDSTKNNKTHSLNGMYEISREYFYDGFLGNGKKSKKGRARGMNNRFWNISFRFISFHI